MTAPSVDSRVFTITVYGTPKPKGSLAHVGKGRLVEQVVGSKPWREAVKWAAIQAKDEAFHVFSGPVAVHIVVTVKKPVSAPKRRRTWPITRSSGDADKHARNCLDALVDAVIMFDDSQVTDLHLIKSYPGQEPGALDHPGAVITVRSA